MDAIVIVDDGNGQGIFNIPFSIGLFSRFKLSLQHNNN
jgi:hypothetical protein